MLTTLCRTLQPVLQKTLAPEKKIRPLTNFNSLKEFLAKYNISLIWLELERISRGNKIFKKFSTLLSNSAADLSIPFIRPILSYATKLWPVGNTAKIYTRILSRGCWLPPPPPSWLESIAFVTSEWLGFYRKIAAFQGLLYRTVYENKGGSRIRSYSTHSTFLFLNPRTIGTCTTVLPYYGYGIAWKQTTSEKPNRAVLPPLVHGT